jgi:hypothetical protein
MKHPARKPYRLVPLSECLLYKLYVAHVEDDEHSSYSVDQMRAMLIGEVSRKLIISALGLLMEPHYHQRVKRHGKAGQHTFAITNEGIIDVERALRRGIRSRRIYARTLAQRSMRLQGSAARS